MEKFDLHLMLMFDRLFMRASPLSCFVLSLNILAGYALFCYSFVSTHRVKDGKKHFVSYGKGSTVLILCRLNNSGLYHVFRIHSITMEAKTPI